MNMLLRLTNIFYDAAWDFSTNLCLLPESLQQNDSSGLNPNDLIERYKGIIDPFLALTGDDIPRQFHASFDQIDSTMRQEVFPALEVIKETWLEISSQQTPASYQDRLRFAEQCVYIGNMIEMDIIALTSGLRDELNAHPY